MTEVSIQIDSVVYDDYITSYQVREYKNQPTEFEIELIGIGSTQQSNIARGKEVQILYGTTCLFKGIVERCNYKSNEECDIKGYGAVEHYLKDLTCTLTDSASTDSAEGRPIYDSKAVSTVLIPEVIEYVSLDDFEDDWATNWIEADDGENPVTETTIKVEGASSVHFGVDASASAQDYATWDSGVDFGDISTYFGANSSTPTKGVIKIKVYFNVLTYLNTTNALEFWIGSDSSNCMKFYLQKSSLTAATWYEWIIDVPGGTKAGTPDWTATDFMRLRVNSVASNTNDFEFYADDLRIENWNVQIGTNTQTKAITVRADYDNKLSFLNGISSVTGSDWWGSYTGTSNYINNFNMAASRGSGVSVKTYTVTGASQNANQTAKEIDLDTFKNSVTILGYGDGVNQKKAVSYHATDNRTTLDGALTASATTVTVVDTTNFGSTGTLWIGQEKVTYTGKTATTFTGCTKGSTGGLSAYAHSSGMEVVDAQYTETVTEANSLIYTYGLMQEIIIDRTIFDQDSLDWITYNKLKEKSRNYAGPVERIVLEPSEFGADLNTVNVGDTVTVTDADSTLSGDYVVYSRVWGAGNEGEKNTLELSNGSLKMMETIKDIKNEAINLGKYMQGATNIFTVNETENAESGTTPPAPIDLFFEIPSDAVAINSIKLAYRNEAPRIWTNVTTSGGGSTTPSGGGSTSGDNSDPTFYSYAHYNSQIYASLGSWTDLYTVSDGTHTSHTSFVLWYIAIENSVDCSFSVRVKVGSSTYYPESGGEHKPGGYAPNNAFCIAAAIDLYNQAVVFQLEPGTTGYWDFFVAEMANAKHTHTTPDHIHSTPNHSHTVDYDIITKTYTTTDIRVYTTNDASGSPSWTERTAALEAIYGTLASAEDASETGLDLTSFFSSTGWKGVRLATNGNSRHKANVTVKCFVESKTIG